MAALVAGVQYGLSSQGNFHENKSLIFVKLTDSAYRAIEDYLRNKNKISQQPTIQFLGNEGQLSFPNPSSNGHGAAFNFSLSGNEDIEGPQGSFECLQSKSKSFEFMGTLPCKMRIQATDDVYAATKQRMAVVEEQQKKNCTRVIKVSDVGRKVKVKKIGSVGALPKRETSPPSYRPPLSTVSVGANKPRNAFSQSRSDGCNNGSSGHLDGHPTLPTNMHPNVHHGRIPSGVRTGGNQDIMRRPIRKYSCVSHRVASLHAANVLAAYTAAILSSHPSVLRIAAVYAAKRRQHGKTQPDGLRDRDRATLAIVLKQVANMSDNTYHLNRHVWNDVQEDWPFYSEQDKQILKRRKPQNLTPPGSDGSSGSGHSPTSTHPGSPPPTIFPSPSGTNCRLPGPDPSGVKRPGYYDNADGIITKRQRISHYKRLPTESSSSSVTNNNNNNNSSNNSSNVQRVRSDSVTRRTQDLAPRPGGSPGHHPSRNRPHPASPGHGRAVARRDEVEALHSPEDGVTVSRRVEEEVESGQWPPVKDKSVWSSGKSNARSTSPEELVKSEERVSEAASSAKGKVVGAEEEAESDRASSEYPDYLTEYTTITTAEQRNRYKADFNADYDEYRYLHTIVETVSRRFAELQEMLEQQEIGSERWNSIKDQIVREYQENKRDQQYPEAKKKFQYLHEKLSHIKRLVLEYDSSVSGQIANVQKP